MQLYLVRGTLHYGRALASFNIYNFVIEKDLDMAKHEAVRLMFKMFEDHSDENMKWIDSMTLIRDSTSKSGTVKITEMTLGRAIENLRECLVFGY